MVRCCVMCVAILLAGGCATRGPVRMPTGAWSGKGTFSYERWAAGEPAASIHRDYQTCICIKPAQVDDRPAFDIEIVSERGELPEGLGPRTHLRLTLVEVKRPCESIAQYRVAGRFNPKPEERPEFEGDTPPIGATCMRVDDLTVLQIVYEEGFSDVLRFRGRGLMKAGSLSDEDGVIHWAESLVQTRPVDRLR